MPDLHQRWQMRECGPARVNQRSCFGFAHHHYRSCAIVYDDALPAVTEPRLSNEGFKRANLLHWRQCVAVHRYQQPTSDVTLGHYRDDLIFKSSGVNRPRAFCCELSA